MTTYIRRGGLRIHFAPRGNHERLRRTEMTHQGSAIMWESEVKGLPTKAVRLRWSCYLIPNEIPAFGGIASDIHKWPKPFNANECRDLCRALSLCWNAAIVPLWSDIPRCRTLRAQEPNIFFHSHHFLSIKKLPSQNCTLFLEPVMLTSMHSNVS